MFVHLHDTILTSVTPSNAAITLPYYVTPLPMLTVVYMFFQSLALALTAVAKVPNQRELLMPHVCAAALPWANPVQSTRDQAITLAQA